MEFFRTKITFIVHSLSKRSREQLQGYLTFYLLFQRSFHDNLNVTNTGKRLIPRLKLRRKKRCQNSSFISFSKQTYIFPYSSWLRKCIIARRKIKISKETRIPFFSSQSYLHLAHSFVNYTLHLTDSSRCVKKARFEARRINENAP